MARQWKVITKRDVGKYWEGFGYVQAQDVGKLYYKDSGGYYVENNEQRAKRLERGGSSQKNPGAVNLPRGKWVNAQVMVTSSGQIKAKIPASVVRRGKKKNGPRYGTSYFVSKSAAVRYYADYEDDPKHAVERKIREGSIHIGKPPLKPGQRLFLLDGGKRYGIEE